MAEILNFFTLSHALLVVAALMLVVSACKLYTLLNAEEHTFTSIFFSLKMNTKWMTWLSAVFFGASVIVVVFAVLHVMGGINPTAPWEVLSFVFFFYLLIGLAIQWGIMWLEMSLYSIVGMLVIKVKELFSK